MSTPPTVTTNQLQDLGFTGQSPSSGVDGIKLAHEGWSKFVADLTKTSKSFQSDARALREAGVTFDEIEKKMKDLGLTGKHLEKVMSGYHRSLKELSELPLGQVLSDWKLNLASLAKAFLPLLSLDL